MSAIGYIFSRTIKNKIRETMKKPGIIIMYVVILALLVVLFISSGKSARPESLQNLNGYAAFLVGIFGAIFGISIVQGLKQGTSIFNLADVNFLFTAPVSPRLILIYGVIRQAGTLVLASAFLLFQFPNMRTNFGITGGGFWGLVLGYVGAGVATQLFSVNIYTFCAGKPGRRTAVERGLNAVLLLLVALLVIDVVRGGSILQSLSAVLGADWWNFVPVVGWARGCAVSIAQSDWGMGLLFFALLVVFSMGCVALMQRSGSEYFEDVLYSAQTAYQKRQAAREGRVEQQGETVNRRIKRDNAPLKGKGASAFFFKRLREQSRQGIGMFLDLTAAAAFLMPVISMFFMGDELISGAELWPVLIMAAYLLIFLGLTGGIGKELSIVYLYLVPATNFQKLMAVIAPDFIKGLVNGLAFAASAMLILRAPILNALSAGLAYASINILYSAGLILIERVLGGSKNKVLIMFIYILGLMFLVAPGVVLSIIIGGNTGNLVWAAWDIGASILIVFLCRNLISKTEQ